MSLTVIFYLALLKLSSAFLAGSTSYSPNEMIRRHHDPRTGSVTSLFGGYDATISQSDPNTSIQVFSNGPLCPYSAQVILLLSELELPFEVTNILKPCPDWYLRINSKGIVPALRNPLDGNEIISTSKACLNYSCDYYERTRGSSCLISPLDSETRGVISNLQDRFDLYICRSLISYLLNPDFGQEEYLKQMMETYLASLESLIATHEAQFLLGKELSLADLYIFPFLFRLEIAIMGGKGYHLSKKYPKLGTWLLLMHERTSSVREVQVSESDLMNNYEEFLEWNDS